MLDKTLHASSGAVASDVQEEIGLFGRLLHTDMSYPKWCASAVRHVLKTKTPFAANLAKTIQLSRSSRSHEGPVSTFFPVPIPCFGVFSRMTCESSASQMHNRRIAQVTHLVVVGFNYWYAGGKFGEMELLQREPSKHHLALYARIKLLIESEGPVPVKSLPRAGRRFPELAARIGELSDALTRMGHSSDPYAKTYAGCEAPKNEDADPVLRPYHDLCPDKMKLAGKGNWDPTAFLSDELCMAFREPKVLLHDGPDVPRPIHDKPETMAGLCRRWDDLDLLLLHKEPIHPSSPVRIFGAYKDESCHRQIGDRRGQDDRECKVQGPSRDLPSGADFCELIVDPKFEVVRISITDRRDFYHRLKCTRAKALANTVGPAVPEDLVKDTRAYAAFLISDSKKRYDRLRHGDKLRMTEDDGWIIPSPGTCFASFKAVLQGDHAGVEIATEAHTSLLQEGGLLQPCSQMRASHPLQSGTLAEGLVIDDYFSVSIEPKDVAKQASASSGCYDKASALYQQYGLLGSPHKDLIDADEGRCIHK